MICPLLDNIFHKSAMLAFVQKSAAARWAEKCAQRINCGGPELRRPRIRPLLAAIPSRSFVASRTGPFDTGIVVRPDDFDKAADAGIRVSAHLAREIEASLTKELTADEALRTLRLLDAVSDTLCKVLDFAECLRNTAADPAWRAAADGAHVKLGQFLYALNAHAPLYLALARITSDASLMARLSHSERRMAILLRREFEKDGIHLPEEQRAVLVRLNAEAARLGSEFSAGTAPSGDHTAEVPLADFPSVWTLPAGVLDQLWMSTPGSRRPILLKHAATAARAARGGEGYSVVVPVPSAAAHFLQRSCEDAAVRRAIAAIEARMYADNVPRLQALREKRAEIAQLAGHPSHAHALTFDRLAGDPANAVTFLQMVSAATLPRALEEMAALAEEKAAHQAEGKARHDGGATVHPATYKLFGTQSGSSSSSGAGAAGAAHMHSHQHRIEDAAVRLVAAYARGGAIQPWDYRFYSERILHRIGGEASRAAVAAAGGPAAVRAAYALPNVLRGLAALCERVFGVQLRVAPLMPGEAWDGGREYALSDPGSGTAQSGLSRLTSFLSGSTSRGGGASTSSAASSSGAGLSNVIKIELLDAAPAGHGASSHASSPASPADEQRVIGVMYLDMRPRNDKFPGAAQFVICSSKEMNPAIDGLLERTLGVATTPTVQATLADGASGAARVATFQRPRVALVCNFDAAEADEAIPSLATTAANSAGGDGAASAPSSTAASAIAGHSGGSVDIGSVLPPHLQRWMLSPSQVITLWHESGHMLHSLLSRVPFQHLSGTRAAFDFVEVPSHTVERWARDYRAAATWALMPAGSGSGPDEAGAAAGAVGAAAAPVPRDYFHFQHVQAAVTSPAHVFSALEMQASVGLSLFDLALHGDDGIVDAVVNPRPVESSDALDSAAAALVGDHCAVPPMQDLMAAIERVASEIAEEHAASSTSSNNGSAAKAASLLSVIHTPDGRLGVLNRLREVGFVSEDLAYIRTPSKQAMPSLEDQLTAPVAEPLEVREAQHEAELQQQKKSGPRASAAASASGSSSSSKRAWHRDSTALYRAVLQRYALLPAMQGNTHHASLSHLVTYGAGYYAYTYAAAISSALWQRLFASDPWSASAGARMRRELLAQGGAEDPAVILQRLLESGLPSASTRRGIPLAPLLREMALLPPDADDSSTGGRQGGADSAYDKRKPPHAVADAGA